MAGMKTIAVFLEQNEASSADFHRGIARFARTRDDWSLIHMGTRIAKPPLSSVTLAADGLLLSSAFADKGAIKEIAARQIPAVNIIQCAPPLILPAVCADNEAAGRLAAEHLLGLGLRHFGYIEMPRNPDDAFRRDGFRRTIESAGGNCAVTHFGELWRPTISKKLGSTMAQWIQSIGSPCGILAFCDPLGLWFLRALRQIGIRVPDDVALVGIDDNDVLCEYCNPPLSSVNLNNQVIAYEAAAMLDRLMRSRRRSPPAQTLIPPIGVIERGSSQMLAVEEDVARVLRLMMANLGRRLSVREMAEHVQISDRALEKKFQRCLGRTPSEEMARLRAERGKRLLVNTEKSIVQIAHEAGYANTGHFCNSFKRSTQMTPGQYRRAIRGDGVGRG
jgi:LacI family transcriptional regulator